MKILALIGSPRKGSNTDILVEKRAIMEYRSFMNRVEFDDESVGLIERIVVDEERHVATWQNAIKILKDKS